MIIWSYVISNPDEITCLPDALDSLAKFSDRIFVVDGGLGGGTLNQHPTHTQPLDMMLSALGQASFSGCPDWASFCWNDTPLTLYDNEFRDPANQRNWILDHMAEESNQPDWIVWIDSDEICSHEFENGIRDYLAGLPADVTNVCPKWLTLIQDNDHYAPALSDWLSHARIHHPNTVRWWGTWHEHMNYLGKRVEWDVRVIHTRLLFRKRLLIQRGHEVVNEGAWSVVTSVPVPDGITWSLTWPKDEPIGAPYAVNLKDYEGGKWTT
jgi:hypothetical protein